MCHRMIAPWVLYASQTGNAEDLAFEVHEAIGGRFVDVEDVDPATLSDAKLLIFVVSTAHRGEFPDSMKSMWGYLLQKRLPRTWLQHTKFSVFGLGDSSYKQYNVAARKLFARLRQLGSTPVVDLHLGDEQHSLGYFGEFEKWKSELLTVSSEYSAMLSPKNYHQYQLRGESAVDFIPTCHEESRNWVQASIISNERITSPTWMQDVRLITADISADYEPGDVLSVKYKNCSAICNAAMELLHEKMSLNMILEINSESVHRKTRLRNSMRTTVGELFSGVLDIQGIPKRSFFKEFAMFATDDEKRQKMIEISGPAGIDIYIDYCVRERRTYLDVMVEFGLRSIPLQHWLTGIPTIVPRKYSIASSPTIHPNRLQLCVGIADYKTPYGRHRQGLCSSYLAQLQPHTLLECKVERGKIRTFSDQPMICIGTGTGISPIRSVIQHRYQNEGLHSVPETLLFQGFRLPGHDDLFSNEWKHILNPSFSCWFAKSQESIVKTYVQHLLISHAPLVARLLTFGGVVVICGSSKRMPDDVIDALIKIMIDQLKMTSESALLNIQQLIRQNRLIVDAW